MAAVPRPGSRDLLRPGSGDLLTVLGKGLPRISRYRSGASRFTIVDPSGNLIVFIRRDEPAELEYGGSTRLTGLAKVLVLDNARILREFKTDDRAAFRALDSGLRRHGETASDLDRALALAALIELSIALDEPERVPGWGSRLREIRLTGPEREQVERAVADPAVLAGWLPAGNPPDGDGPVAG